MRISRNVLPKCTGDRRWYRALPMVALAAVLGLQTAGAAGVPNDAASVEHALRRLTYGPRPGDVDSVRAMGLAKWIDRQLDPGRIDDAALTARLLPPAERPAGFESPQQARQWGRQSVQVLAANRVVRARYSERQLE